MGVRLVVQWRRLGPAVTRNDVKELKRGWRCCLALASLIVKYSLCVSACVRESRGVDLLGSQTRPPSLPPLPACSPKCQVLQ